MLGEKDQVLLKTNIGLVRDKPTVKRWKWL